MSEQAAQRLGPAKAVGPVQTLLGLLQAEDALGVSRLTLEMIDETAGWIKDGIGRGEVAAEIIRTGWLRDIRKERGEWEEDIAEYERRWDEAFAKAKPESEPAKIDAQPKIEPEPEPVVEDAEPEACAVPAEAVKPDSLWASPEAGTPRLLELPGVAGEVQQHYLDNVLQPSQGLSVGVGVMVTAALACGNVVGPSGLDGCSLHQIGVGITVTGGGKQGAIDITKTCIIAAGAKAMLGPNRFKSGAGVIRWVGEHKKSIAVQDEFGGFLMKLQNPNVLTCEIEISERFREFWALGPKSIYNSPHGASDDSEMIEGANLNVFGFGVTEDFFAACKNSDIANGHLNRMLLFYEPDLIRMMTQREGQPLSVDLIARLVRLYGLKPFRLKWGVGAREIWEAEVERVYREPDPRKQKLWSRSPEKVIRTASAFAAGGFGKVVERSHMEIAQKILHESDRVFREGIEKAERERSLGHAELKKEIERRVKTEFHSSPSKAEIKRSFRHNTKSKGAIDDALTDMVDSEIFWLDRVSTGGRAKQVYRWEGDAGWYSQFDQEVGGE